MYDTSDIILMIVFLPFCIDGLNYNNLTNHRLKLKIGYNMADNIKKQYFMHEMFLFRDIKIL